MRKMATSSEVLPHTLINVMRLFTLSAPCGSLGSPPVASRVLGCERRSFIGKASFMNVTSPTLDTRGLSVNKSTGEVPLCKKEDRRGIWP
jgi:hypothetical protein